MRAVDKGRFKMLDLAFSVVWLLVVIVAIVDQHLQLKAVRAELAEEPAEAAQERIAAAQRHMTFARVSQEQHIEMLCILRANIVPDRVSAVDACYPSNDTAPPTPREPALQPETNADSAPVTSREPAITRSQRPPAPALDWEHIIAPGVGPPAGETSIQT
jgi:hypothetical protein